MKKIAMLTGGGDCPGLNAVIRAVTRKGLLEGYEVLGFRNGWAGVLKGDYFPMTFAAGFMPICNACRSRSTGASRLATSCTVSQATASPCRPC